MAIKKFFTCHTCGRNIEHDYRLDGKIYGYNCYKLALAQKLAYLEEQKNDDYSRKCIALIEIFSQKIFKDQWNKDFQTSILKQWNDCKKLTGKQFDCIVKKLNEVETVEYYLTYYIISKDYDIQINYIYSLFSNPEILKQYKYDDRLHELIRDYNKTRINKRGYKFYIVTWEDIDYKEEIIEITKDLELIRQDEYNNIIEVINI